MINSLLTGLLNVITLLINVLLTPINLLVSGLFPSANEFVSTFTYTINNYVSPYVGWFVYLLPPHFKTLLGLWLVFMVGLFTAYYSYKAIVKIYKIIQKIKFW